MSDAAIQIVPLSAARAGFSAFRAIVHGSDPVIITPVQEEPAIDAYAQGLADGQAMAAATFESERAQYLAMLTAAEALQCDTHEELAQLIGNAVSLLVSQIVDAAPIDAAWLAAQTHKAASLIGECDAARVLRLNPEDLALVSDADLPLPTEADATLPRGEMRIDGSAGWIEHGRSTYLEALRSALSAGDAE